MQEVLIAYDNYQTERMTASDISKLWVQGLIAVLLILCLSLHLASVGLIGLMVIILATTFCGIVRATANKVAAHAGQYERHDNDTENNLEHETVSSRA